MRIGIIATCHTQRSACKIGQRFVSSGLGTNRMNSQSAYDSCGTLRNTMLKNVAKVLWLLTSSWLAAKPSAGRRAAGAAPGVINVSHRVPAMKSVCFESQNTPPWLLRQLAGAPCPSINPSFWILALTFLRDGFF